MSQNPKKKQKQIWNDSADAAVYSETVQSPVIKANEAIDIINRGCVIRLIRPHPETSSLFNVIFLFSKIKGIQVKVLYINIYIYTEADE